MNIFLSYSSVRRDVALRLKLALEAEQHDVFFDRDDLGAGDAYHQAIREALAAADLLVFLVSPESVAAGSYTLTELGLAEAKWSRPAGRVLPVVVAATTKGSIPPYLLAVTLLEPRGELVAETLAAVAVLSRPQRQGRRRWALAAAAGLVLLVGGLFGLRHLQVQREAAAEQARQVQAASQAAGQAARLCIEGGFADGFAQLTALASQPAAPPAVKTASEDCAMAWLRWGRRNPGQNSFAQMVAPLRPLLAQALVSGAKGQRAADLRAHLGWADRLVWIDENNPGIDPTPHFRQALADDADNVYAHAMWAFWLLVRAPLQPQQALPHFEQARKSGRDLPFVRQLQLGSMVTSDELGREALRVLNQMRQGNEPLEADRKPRIWSYLYSGSYREDKARRLLDALDPEEGLKTFLWLFAQGGPDPSQQPQWRLLRGQLLTHAGRAPEARADLLALQQELRAERSSGPLVDSVNRLLTRP